MYRFLLSAAALGLMATSSLAASSTPDDWTAFYIGLNGNWSWVSTDISYPSQTVNNVSYGGQNVGSQTGNGPGGGIQFGFDYQMGNAVVGILAMTSVNAIDSSEKFGSSKLTSELTSYGGLSARFGYLLQPDVLAYAKGGIAFGSFKYTDKNSTEGYSGSSNDNRLQGWSLGGGVEYRFAPNWSAFAEYDWTDFGDNNIELSYKNASWGNSWKYDYKQSISSAVVGVNYRF